MPDEPKVSEQDEEQQLFEEQGEDAGAEAASESAPPAEAEEKAPEAQIEGPDRGAIAQEILTDKELAPADFARAQHDPKFLSGLVDARIEEQKGKTPPAVEKEETPPGAESPGKRKARRGFQRTIERQNERILALEAELTSRTRKEQTPAREPSQSPVGQRMSGPEIARPEPKEEQFQNFEEFEKAHRSWEIETTASRIVESRLDEERQRAQAVRAESQRRQAETKRAELANSAFEAGRKAHEDFDDVIGKAGDVVITDPMDYAILRSENPGEILYHIASNPKEGQRLAEMPDAEVFLEIGRLDARLGKQQKEKTGESASPEVKTPEVSRTPPPPKTVGGSTRSGKTIDYWTRNAPPDEFREAVLGRKI